MIKNTFKLIILSLFALAVFASCTNDTVNNTVISSASAQKNTSASVFVYNVHGVAQYKYDSKGYLTDIISLDKTVMNPFVDNAESYICSYEYDGNGTLTSLINSGNSYTLTQFDDNGRPVKGESNDDKTVEIRYHNNGHIKTEGYYENGNCVFTTEYDTNGHPSKLTYSGIGEINFSYGNKEVYVNITYEDETQSAPETVLYIGEHGYPTSCMESVDSAMQGTTWTYDENMRCITTTIESLYEGQSYYEQYEIYYEGDKVSKIEYFTPDSSNEPHLTEMYEFSYFVNGTIKTQTAELYDANSKITNKYIYTYFDGKRGSVRAETYTDGELSSSVLYKYGENGEIIQ